MELGDNDAREAQSVSHLDLGEGGTEGTARMGTKARSAPGSIAGDKPKWITSKSNTLKDIETWATNGHQKEATDFGRHSGQLMDNVTEQRMLQCKLWELSKERHKFLTQNTYEKKIFLDRQQRKSGVMKEMLDGVTAEGKRSSWSEEAMKRRMNRPLSQSMNSARSLLLDRVDPKNKRDRPREVQAKDAESRHSSSPIPTEVGRRARPCFPQVIRSVSQESNLGKDPTFRTPFPTEPCIPKARPSPPRPKTSFDRVINSELCAAVHQTNTVRFADCSPQNTSKFQHSEELGASQSWTPLRWNRAPTLSAKSRVTDRDAGGQAVDTRYAMLKESLSENYQNSPQDISSIVSKIAALRMPPKRPMEGKPRAGNKIRQFMRERGIEF